VDPGFGSPEAAEGYKLLYPRWMMACSSPCEQSTKFNGGLFTVGMTLLAIRNPIRLIMTGLSVWALLLEPKQSTSLLATDGTGILNS